MVDLSHNDNPTDIDGLDQASFIKDIAQVIKNCEPPKGLAINGYWGTGKTSCLMQLRNELGSDFVVPIWFEAWRYQNEPTPIVALLHNIREEFSTFVKGINETKKILSVTFLGVLSAFDETIKAASGGIFAPKLSDIPKIAGDYEAANYSGLLQTRNISRILEEAINVLLGNSENTSKKKKKLVIFIDDLDRCNPEAALKLLEGIKVYLNLQNCVVVFAIDQRQIEHALKKALDLKDSSDEHQAREYLEKICQDIYHLPLPDANKKAIYLDNLLSLLDLGGQVRNPVQKNEIAKQRRENIKNIVKRFDCLPANPRKIKALANRLSVVLRKNVNLNTERDYAILIAIAIIYTFHRELNEHLNKDPGCISGIVSFAHKPNGDETTKELMKGIQPSYDHGVQLPTNPSDSHVFRLHQLLVTLDVVTPDDIKQFLGK